MITKEKFIVSSVKEIEILRHLFTKINPKKLDYRPTEKQRSTRELLQYIGHAFAAEMNGIKTGSIGDFRATIAAAYEDPVENFPRHMDQLAALVRSVIAPMTEDDLEAEIDLFGRGAKQTRSAWLLELFFKNLIGYKMQLFLYIKASGNGEIGTRNLWSGEDAKA